MDLTPAQQTILVNDIAANNNTVNIGGQTFVIKDLAHNPDTAVAIAAFYNQNVGNNFATTYWVLKTSLTRHEYTDLPGVDTDGVTPTIFVWGGATGGYISRSQGERDMFSAVFNKEDKISPSLANVRTGFDDLFSGNGAGAQANRTHFRAVGRRPVTIAEKLFVTATVGGPTQSGARGAATNPDSLGWEGPLQPNQITGAWGV